MSQAPAVQAAGTQVYTDLLKAIVEALHRLRDRNKTGAEKQLADLRAETLVKLLQGGQESGDLRSVRMALGAIEAEAKRQLQARRDEYKLVEAVAQLLACERIAQLRDLDAASPGNGRSPESIGAAIGDIMARIHAQEAGETHGELDELPADDEA